MLPTLPQDLAPSPCIQICRVGTDGVCVGCLRSLAEIAAWTQAGQSERLQILRAVADRKSFHPPKCQDAIRQTSKQS
ncbi:MAG TPA: DUF1289 domain-containing protein [Planctomycetaceae bacterium]|nr:DUF1289 domain-containing protein [Planctomycetaceae bacterium]